jgi:hypothetical protein
MCVTNSSQRGLAGAVKIFFVEIGGGVQAIKEIRADGSVKITIKGNAEAGLEFGAPGAEVDACPPAASTAARGRSRPRRRPTSSSTSSPAR